MRSSTFAVTLSLNAKGTRLGFWATGLTSGSIYSFNYNVQPANSTKHIWVLCLKSRRHNLTNNIALCWFTTGPWTNMEKTKILWRDMTSKTLSTLRDHERTAYLLVSHRELHWNLTHHLELLPSICICTDLWALHTCSFPSKLLKEPEPISVFVLI